MSPNHRRRPRFRRVTDNLPGLKLTPRDLELLRHLGRHRFLRSTHLCALVDGSQQGTLRRLSALFHHAYVDRPLAQLDRYYKSSGSAPLVYALAPRGAALLRSTGIPFDAISWNRKGASEPGTLFLEHALLISDCAVDAALSCQRHDSEFRNLHDLASSTDAKGAWRTSIDGGKEVGVVPDAIFSIQTREEDPCLYFLEADRGTMPVRRAELDQSSFFRKLLAYHATWKACIHREQFQINRFRVLTVTSSTARRDNLLEACSSIPGGHGLFLFAEASEIERHGDFLTFLWSTPISAHESILRGRP